MSGKKSFRVIFSPTRTYSLILSHFNEYYNSSSKLRFFVGKITASLEVISSMASSLTFKTGTISFTALYPKLKYNLSYYTNTVQMFENTILARLREVFPITSTIQITVANFGTVLLRYLIPLRSSLAIKVGTAANIIATPQVAQFVKLGVYDPSKMGDDLDSEKLGDLDRVVA